MEFDDREKKLLAKGLDMLCSDLLKSPFYDRLIDLCPEITKKPDMIEKFINSCYVEFNGISSLDEISELARAFRNEHNTREDSLGNGYLEEIFESMSVNDCEYDLRKQGFDEELPAISGGILLKVGCNDPFNNIPIIEQAGFASILELGFGIELSAIYLAPDFRGKELKGKRCSELLLKEIIRYAENRYPMRMFFAYVEKGNVFPLPLLRKFGFKKGLTDRLGYDMYVRD